MNICIYFIRIRNKYEHLTLTFYPQPLMAAFRMVAIQVCLIEGAVTADRCTAALSL